MSVTKRVTTNDRTTVSAIISIVNWRNSFPLVTTHETIEEADDAMSIYDPLAEEHFGEVQYPEVISVCIVTIHPSGKTYRWVRKPSYNN